MLFSLDPELQDIAFENRFAGELRAKRIEDDKNATKIKISLPTFKDDVLDALIRDAPINTQDLKGRAATVLGVEETDVLAVAGYPFGPQARGVIIQLKDDVDLGSLTPDAKAFVSCDTRNRRGLSQWHPGHTMMGKPNGEPAAGGMSRRSIPRLSPLILEPLLAGYDDRHPAPTRFILRRPGQNSLTSVRRAHRDRGGPSREWLRRPGRSPS